ncbi:MAG: type II toxin-antitoxin system RelE family toxin [Fimbriimonadales bacterium]
MQRRIAAAIDTLRETPRPRGVVKLKGHQRLYRLRVGRYRIVYEIDDEAKRVRITRVRHRREAYD